MNTDRIAKLKGLLNQIANAADEAARQANHVNALRQQVEAVIGEHEHDCLHEQGGQFTPSMEQLASPTTGPRGDTNRTE